MSDTALDPAKLLAFMEKSAQLLACPPTQVRKQLDAARLAYERGHLVVAGGEGVGKSTLINAMLGADVAPTAEYEAGTVAPVYFLHAARHSPGYRVVHRTSEGELLTSEVDREGFEQWLLQEHNPDNERGVLRGEITLNHPLLRDGLRLVDMPGTGGMSSAVAAETHAYLSGTPLTAVLVNQGSRVMSTLVKVCDELRENQCDVSIAALVVNEHVQDNLAPDKLDIHLERLRNAFRKSLVPQLPAGALGLWDSNIYVLHLRSLASGKPVSPEHDRQWQAFLDTVTRHVRDHGLAVSARDCLAALQTLDKALAARSGLLADLRADRIPKPELSTLVRQATAAARPGLAALEQAESAPRPVHWPKVAAVAGQQAARLTRLLDMHERAVSEKPELPHVEAKRIEDDLNKALEAASAEVGKATEETAGELASELAPACWDILAAYAAVLPVAALPPRPTIIGIAATAETGTYRFMGLSEANAQMWGELLSADWLLPAAIFAGLVGTIGSPIAHYALGGNRGETLRQIRSLRSKVQENLSVDINDSPLYRRWCEARQETVNTCVDMVVGILDRMGEEVIKPSAPEQLRIALERQQREIDAARATLAEWLDDSAPV